MVREVICGLQELDVPLHFFCFHLFRDQRKSTNQLSNRSTLWRKGNTRVLFGLISKPKEVVIAGHEDSAFLVGI